MIRTEVCRLLEKGAVTEVKHHPQAGFHSTLFLVPKKGEGQRPVVNLKTLNCFVRTHHFKMKGNTPSRIYCNLEIG